MKHVIVIPPIIYFSENCLISCEINVNLNSYRQNKLVKHDRKKPLGLWKNASTLLQEDLPNNLIRIDGKLKTLIIIKHRWTRPANIDKTIYGELKNLSRRYR